jgi:hypothetical protein
MVEATEGCDINQGKCAKRAKSKKFVKQISVEVLRFQNSQDNLQKVREKTLEESLRFSVCREI